MPVGNGRWGPWKKQTTVSVREGEMTPRLNRDSGSLSSIKTSADPAISRQAVEWLAENAEREHRPNEMPRHIEVRPCGPPPPTDLGVQTTLHAIAESRTIDKQNKTSKRCLTVKLIN